MREGAWLPVPAKPPELARRRSATAPGVGLALLLIGALLATRCPALGALIALSGSIMVVSFVRMARRTRRLRLQTARIAEKEVRRDLGAPDAVLVELQVRQGRAITGEDQGALWFEEGRLLFSGARTSFGLFAGDVAPGTRKRLAESSRSVSLRLPLNAKTRAGRVSLVVRTLNPQTDPEMARTGYAVRSWLAQGAEGEGQGPPLTLALDAPSPTVLFLRATATTAAWLVLLPIVGLLGLGVAATCWGVPFLGLFLIGFAARGRRLVESPFELWDAWRDRLRLEAG